MIPPKVFVSYAWESETHKLWVKSLAWSLREDGVDAILDQWETAPGDQLPLFMEESIRKSDFVLIVCTPKYKARSDSRKGGVGYEGDVMTAEAFTGVSRRKFIPVLASGAWDDSSPSWLKGSYFLDISEFPEKQDVYEELLRTLHSRREPTPPVRRGLDGESSGPVTDLHRAESIEKLSGKRTLPPQQHMGSEWTYDSEASAEWPQMWQTLVKVDPTPELMAMGRWWLQGHEDREEWRVVWETLVKVDPTPELMAMGRWWLQGHEDREEWRVVWETLVKVDPTPELMAMGRWWLQGHEDREEWRVVWETLVKVDPTPELMAMGRWWLQGHEDR